MTWPRNDDEDFLDNRALAWSRCRDQMPDRPDPTDLSESEWDRLIHDFAASRGTADDVSRSLAELFLDYGAGYIGAGPIVVEPRRGDGAAHRLATPQGHTRRRPRHCPTRCVAPVDNPRSTQAALNPAGSPQ